MYLEVPNIPEIPYVPVNKVLPGMMRKVMGTDRNVSKGIHRVLMGLHKGIFRKGLRNNVNNVLKGLHKVLLKGCNNLPKGISSDLRGCSKGLRKDLSSGKLSNNRMFNTFNKYLNNLILI